LELLQRFAKSVFQHLIETQLVLCSNCEAVHIGIDVLQELVSGMNLFSNFIIYPHVIPHDISERGLIYVEILPITTLLAIVEWKTGFVPPSIEALIRTKTNIGITSKVDVSGDRWAVDAHVAHFSTVFTRYSGVDYFEMIEARVLKLLHKNINLGGEHVHPSKLVNLVGASLSVLLNQFMSFLSTESKERTSSSSIYMLPGSANQPMIEALDDEPFLHAVMGACRDIILQMFPFLDDGLIHELLKPRDPVS
jgi:hypothetical protein